MWQGTITPDPSKPRSVCVSDWKVINIIGTRVTKVNKGKQLDNNNNNNNNFFYSALHPRASQPQASAWGWHLHVSFKINVILIDWLINELNQSQDPSALTNTHLPLGGQKQLKLSVLLKGNKCHERNSKPHSAKHKHLSLNLVLLSTRPQHPIILTGK